MAQERTSSNTPPTPVPRPGTHRLISAPVRVLPDFLLIGAQKSGTTDLDRRISASPRILPRLTKECRVLTGRRPTTLACRAFQETRFRRSGIERRHGGRARAGDACPYYLFHPRTPTTARRLLGPDIDLIVLLRDPAIRAWSHYRHERRLGMETLDFESALSAEKDRLAGEHQRLRDDPDAVSGPHEHFSYFARGRYADQLSGWFDAFDRERFLVLFAEDYFDAPVTVGNRVLSHLGLPAIESHDRNPALNSGDDAEPPPDTIRRLRERFAPCNEELHALLERKPPWPTA